MIKNEEKSTYGDKVKINFKNELGTEASNIFKRAFVSFLKKHDKFHNGIVTAEKFCNSIRETDECLRNKENIWNVLIESEDKCNVTSPIIVSIMSLVQITNDKYVNCKPLYLDVERIESTVILKNPYNESAIMVTQIKKNSLEKDHVKYSVRCPKMFLEDLYPPALESTNKYSNKNRQNDIFEINKMKNTDNSSDLNFQKLPSLRALPIGKLEDFRKLYAMWNKCMISDEDFILHMKKDLGIEAIPREFLLQVANKGPSRTLSFRDAICSLFINDIDSLRKYRSENLVPKPSRMPIEAVYNPITHENITEKNSERVLDNYNKGYGKILSSICLYNDEILKTFKSEGRKHKPMTNEESILKYSLEHRELELNNNKGFVNNSEICNNQKPKFDFFIDNKDSDEERERLRGKKIGTNPRVSVTMPEVIQMQLKRCISGETCGNTVRQYLKHFGIPISVKLDIMLRRSDEDGSVSFTSLMKEVYKSIKNMKN